MLINISKRAPGPNGPLDRKAFIQMAAEFHAYMITNSYTLGREYRVMR